MASDTLKVFGTTYTNVAGFKATDSNDATKTYIRPEGSQTITSNGTYDVTSKASAIVNVPSGGVDVSDTTATVSEVMSGYYFYTANGTKTEGGIEDRTGFSGDITTKNGDITIPQGYHDGEGGIGIANSEKNKIIAENIKSGVTILGVSGSLTPGTDVSDTTVVASDVLETKDFYLANGTKTTGTMADQSGTQKLGTTFASTNYMGLYPNSPGYYDTTSRVVMARADFGDATASDVASGKTFTSSAGWTIEGTASIGGIGTLLATQSLGSQSTTSTSAVEIDQTVTVSGINDYDLLIVETSVDTVTLNRHTSTTGLILLAATSTIGTKTVGTISTLKHNTKISSSSVTSARTSTTAYGVYPSAVSLSSGTATITMSKKYNSTQTGTINGTYTTRVYGVSLFNLIGG